MGWLYKTNQNRIKPPQDKMMAVKDLKQPINEKELKSLLGATQMDSLRKLLKKDNEWLSTEENPQTFENLKQKITEIPCLARYNSNYPNVITTDASTKGLRATLWQERQTEN